MFSSLRHNYAISQSSTLQVSPCPDFRIETSFHTFPPLSLSLFPKKKRKHNKKNIRNSLLIAKHIGTFLWQFKGTFSFIARDVYRFLICSINIHFRWCENLNNAVILLIDFYWGLVLVSNGSCLGANAWKTIVTWPEPVTLQRWLFDLQSVIVLSEMQSNRCTQLARQLQPDWCYHSSSGVIRNGAVACNKSTQNGFNKSVQLTRITISWIFYHPA